MTDPPPNSKMPAHGLAARPNAEWLLFAAATAIYLISRLYGIERFPIYFFSDEARYALYAQNLLDHGLKSARGEFLPIYFEGAESRWMPLLSVYLQGIPTALIGKSILVARAMSVMVSVLAAAAVAFMLKFVFQSRTWWSGALLVAVAPAWFLHSRTAFETVMMASFYAGFLLFYMLYRTRSARFLFPAIVFGTAAFYTYSNGQLIMVTCGVMLLTSDFPYHLKNWRTVIPGLVLIALLAVPVLRLQATQPQSMATHLRTIDSYWFHDIPLSAKIARFATTYAYGLSPAYWFIPNAHDLPRHIMKGYGHLNWLLLPFFLIGVGMCLWRVKSSVHRALLIGLLATPVGAALAEVSVTRVMAFIPPACVLMGLGIDAAIGLLKRHVHVARGMTATALLVLFTTSTAWMLCDSLHRGPLWFTDYGLYGMQYGARQLFVEVVPEILQTYPDTMVSITPTWANAPDLFVNFFLSKEQAARVEIRNVDYYMAARRPLDANRILVMTPNEHENAQASGRFKSIRIERMLPCPDGTAGFYFTRLEYADNLDEQLAAEREERNKPVRNEAIIDGQRVRITHSQLDMGTPQHLFDGDTFTLARGLQANPLVFEFAFPEPRPISALVADFASMDFILTAKLYATDDAEPVVYSGTFKGLLPEPHVDIAFDGGPPTVTKLRLEIEQLNAGEEVHIHVRELELKK